MRNVSDVHHDLYVCGFCSGGISLVQQLFNYTMAHIQGIQISSMESNPNPQPILFHTVHRD